MKYNFPLGELSWVKNPTHYPVVPLPTLTEIFKHMSWLTRSRLTSTNMCMWSDNLDQSSGEQRWKGKTLSIFHSFPAAYHLAVLVVCTFRSSLDMHDAAHTMMISDIATSAWLIDFCHKAI